MNAHTFKRSLISAAILATTSAIVGCSNAKPMVILPNASSPTDSTAANNAVNANAKTDTTEPTFNAPDAMAKKAAAYSQQVETMLQSDPNLGPTTAPSTAAPNNPAPNSPPRFSLRDQYRANNAEKNPSLLPNDSSALAAMPKDTPPPRVALEPMQVDDRATPAAAAIETSPGTANPTGAVALNNNSRSVDLSAGANSAANLSPTNSSAGPKTAPAPPSPTAGELAQKIESRVKDYPRDLSAHLDYQLLHFLMDDRVPDMNSLASLPTEDRELLASMLDGLINFRTSVRADNNMLLSKKVRPMIEMADRLRGQADLTVPTISLCTAVRTFGEYDPIEPAQFAAGAEHPAILYCEVENFSSQLDDKHRWQTKLSEEAVLYTESGMQVWSDKSEPIEDYSRNRRHDFFIVKRLTIPANLAVGRYLLKVTITDQQMSRVAEATAPIVIAVQ